MSDKPVKPHELTDPVHGMDQMQWFVHLRQVMPEARAEDLASLLQLGVIENKGEPEEVDRLLERAVDQGEAQRFKPKKPPLTKSAAYPPKAQFPVLALSQIERKERVDSDEIPHAVQQAEAFEGDLDDGVSYQPRAPQPLVSWSQQWPRIRALLGRPKTTRRLDMNRIIRSAEKQMPLSRLPWKEKDRWPNELVVIVDASKRLAPYYNDYDELVSGLSRWLGERMKVVFFFDLNDKQFSLDGKEYDDFPCLQRNMNLLYLGDLGFLDEQNRSSYQWLALGAQFLRYDCRVTALLTASRSDWDMTLSRYYQMAGWEEGGSEPGLTTDDASSSAEQVETLLMLLSLAFEVTPALVRQVRQAFGLNVSVESLILQSPHLQGNFSFFPAFDGLRFFMYVKAPIRLLPSVSLFQNLAFFFYAALLLLHTVVTAPVNCMSVQMA